MSLIKWTLAAAGAVMGMHYLSERHRRRLSGDGGMGSRHSLGQQGSREHLRASMGGVDEPGAGVTGQDVPLAGRGPGSTSGFTSGSTPGAV